MSNVSVFVGHSFTDEDEQVVGKFLNLLRELTEAFPGFTWDHARRAEPKDLTEKVLEKMEGKDAFIGICTRKERVLRGNAPSRGIGSWHFVRDNEFEWKTSDWIIQEIGLAVGRGMKLILLIENGVRKPGGLEGNVEYVQFDRNNPEAAFLKVIQMIRALRPMPHPVTSTTGAVSSPPAKARTDVEQGSEWWKNPLPEWTYENYRIAILIATFDGDEEVIRKVDAACRENVSNLDLAGWQAYCESVQICYGKGGNIRSIKKLADENPGNVDVLESWGKSLVSYKEYRTAATIYEKAANISNDPRKSIDLLKQAALAFRAARENDAATRIADRIRERYEPDLLVEVLGALRDIHSNDSCVLGLTERLLEIDPSNNDLRSSLAYIYSERGSEDIALYHYLRIPEKQRTALAWNNLGVSLQSFQLRAKAIKAYKAAKSMGESIAMSNLAFALIGAGFIEEARRECEEALKVKDYHENIDRALAQLKDIPEQEESKAEEILQSVIPKVEFIRKFGNAITQRLDVSLDGTWIHPKCDLELKVSGGQISAFGTYKRPFITGLAAGLFGQAKGEEEISLRITGRIYGCAMECNLSKDVVGGRTASPLLIGEQDEVLLMYLSESASEIQVLQGPHKRNPEIFALRRKGVAN